MNSTLKAAVASCVVLCIVLCLAVTGCGNQKLAGKVSFPDGEVLTTGTIVFSSGTSLSRSFIRPDGSFDVGSLKEADGIPPGVYKVYIIGAVKSYPDPADPSLEIIEPLIDAKYASRETTPLEITIPSEAKIDFVVDRAQ
ncbi:MAG TPA: hypothetical protein DEB39_13515 [Planctomycetaceae bacterium]|nr:hypothetical protein [Planctomycetaceae bacterium]